MRTKGVRGNNPARGRPLGLLLAWLVAASRKGDRKAHGDMLVAKRQTPEDLELLSLSVREAGRRWLVDHEMHDLLSLERPLLPGEPDEPIGIA